MASKVTTWRSSLTSTRNTALGSRCALMAYEVHSNASYRAARCPSDQEDRERWCNDVSRSVLQPVPSAYAPSSTMLGR